MSQARIGIPRHYYMGLDVERRAIMETAIETLKQEGAVIIDPVDIVVEQQNWNNDVICYEFKRDLNHYLAQLPDTAQVHSLRELIEYNEANAEIALKYGQDTLLRAEASVLTEQEYMEKRQQYNHLPSTEGIDYVLERYELDALLLPGDVDGMYIAARLGHPLITVPAGYSEQGVVDGDGDSTKGPFGIVFSGKAFSEPTLIKLAYAYEQATMYRYPPQLSEK
ncbi:hypothetical protein RE628_16485 [Paenibacillus sp. D2_2]|uniref:hypothetical protein n=1 Tax=Paenibacillus sp. D2_2 TaxID=3073092 RepID=UPI0028151C53|nr:hypothetical protein [Paenibacillus sp. D2_2]WMT39101.1 hypothetical protein RE628_16485 [Paenibacillus sp. D2_2]